MNSVDSEIRAGEGLNPGSAAIKAKASGGNIPSLVEGPIEWVVFLAAVFLLTFTETPIPFRFLAPFLLVLLVPKFRRGTEKWLLVAAAFTGIRCLVGAGYVLWTGDGTIASTCYPSLRELGIGIIVLAALNGKSFKTVMLLIAIWAGLQCWAIGFELRGGSSELLLPFPVYSADDLHIIAIFGNRERVRGFTFESGIVGGMASVLLLLVILSGYLELRSPRRSLLKVLGLIAIGLPLMGILAVTFTKSGVFVMATAFLVLLVSSLLTVDFRSILIAVAGMVIASAIVAVAIDNSPGASEYVDLEVKRFQTFLTSKDTGGIESSGLATRVETAKLAFMGIPDFPLGLGFDGMKAYVNQHLKDVSVTSDMEEDFFLGGYGLKAYFFNTIAISGILGLILMVAMFVASTRPYLYVSQRRSFAYPVALTGGLLALSLSAELLPYMGLCALVYCAGTALKREGAGGSAGKPGRVRRSKRGRSNPPVPVAGAVEAKAK